MPYYGSIDEMLATLPKDEKILVNRLRALVTECLPKAEEKSYYDMGVPFFRHNKLICFIWPPSLFWGKKGSIEQARTKGTSLGFNQGYLMSNEDGVLKAEGRKQVYVLYIKSLKELDEDLVKALLFEAGMIDDEFGEKKKKRSARKANRR